ncbi:MAG: GTP-binding protein [Xanthomonadales bacterium]|nr:GTP-binding protein [Xanthomonadales bacterium]MCP5475663.1 GTP-binding protein [Rhodanobacteraceae bacterium]
MTEVARKICMLGDFAVGKTSLVGRYVRSTFSEKYLTTVGVKVDSKRVEIEGSGAVKLVLWDLAGKSELDSLNRSYIRGAHGLMLVADGTREASLRAALYLLMQSQKQLPGVPVVLMVNKLDLIDRWEVSASDISRLQQSLPTFRTSALDGEGVEAAFSELGRLLLGGEA